MGAESLSRQGEAGQRRARGQRSLGRQSGRRRASLVAIGVLAVLLLLDLVRAPQHQLSARFLVASIELYQATLSPLMPSLGVHCRFTPTCSHYGVESIRKHGAVMGTWRTMRRVLRCGPWTEAGTVDPP